MNYQTFSKNWIQPYHNGKTVFLDGKNDMSCKYCNKTYSNARWLLRHEKDHKKKSDGVVLDGSYKCSCCKASFGTKEECKDHQKAMHANMLSKYKYYFYHKFFVYTNQQILKFSSYF